MAKKLVYVISLGGSLVVPEAVDVKFLKAFRVLVLRRVRQGEKFVLIVGGGKICRQYQKSLSRIVKTRQADLDWLGIYSTRFNAQLVRLMFGRLAYPEVIDFPNRRLKHKGPIFVAGGWIPGRSTDDDAVRLAKVYKASTIINLSNIDYVYTADPRKAKNAKPIKRLTWAEYAKMVKQTWAPGANVPFDPVAAKFARKQGQTVIIADGKNLKNLENYLSGKNFIGTVIS